MEDPKQPPSSNSEGPTVVGIGASAGGLAALKTFFQNVPPDSGLAFVVVVHLSPDHKSHLAEVLQPHVPFPIFQVNAETQIQANQAYVIPPNANLTSIDTHLRLSELPPERRDRAPIDHFFRTLSKTHDGRSIGVILSGTGSDGTLGVKDIKAKNGFVIAQDPNEAEYDGMPQSAITTGFVDKVLPVAEIPAAVIRYDRTRPNLDLRQEAGELPERVLLHKIFAQLRARTDRDFSRYKRSTILRRIARRMQLNYIEDIQKYLELLRENPEEVRALADDLLITVTHFFRDPEVFEKLSQDILPKIFSRKGHNEFVRVWSVGCATGEEAYSLAILLLEEAARRELPPNMQIFASDLHKISLDKAREGLYSGDIETDVSEERLRRFFQKENGGYRVRKEVRDLVVFAPHNLLGDPPFSRVDLISCRNLMIYLQRDVQRDVIELFHYALIPEGVLLLGNSETLDSTDLFQVEDKKLCLFRKRNVPGPEPRLPVFPLIRGRIPEENSERHTDTSPVAYASLHNQFLEQYALPSILVSPENKVVHLSSRVGRYLTLPGGEPTNNVLKLVREELRIELRSLLQTAREQKSEANSLPIPVKFNGHATPVTLRVRVRGNHEHEGFALVIFDENEVPVTAGSSSTENDHATVKVDELEQELARTKQRLQAIVEEYETSQEEMKASSEEMQSTNEELRSTMEELETSKEELQSINEELQTVNQENRHKVEELAQLSSDLTNLLAATDIATLFLDRELRILRFTPRLGELFNIRVTDRGRPISDLTHRLGYDELRSDAQSVLDRLIPVEREVRDEENRWYLTRVLPYRSTDDRIEGIVLTFIDISTRKAAEEEVRQSEERYRLLVENAREYAIFMLSADGTVSTWNAGAQRLFGYTAEEIVNRPVAILFTPEDREANCPSQELQHARVKGKASDERWHQRKDGSRFWVTGVVEALREGSELKGFVKVLRDNTESKKAEDQIAASGRDLQAANQALVRANEDLKHFAFAASHDLRAPLRSLSIHTEFLKDAWDRGDRPSAEVALRQVIEGANRMDSLLMDLLSYTRLATPGERESESADLNAALSSAIANLRATVEAAGATITHDPLPTVRGAQSRFIELLQNLLDNSLKYHGPDNPKVHLGVKSQPDQWVFSFQDNGMGIPPRYRTHVFEPFKRLHGDERPGTGMGLPICKRIVNLHGGDIWVESDGSMGTSFIFTLPKREKDAS